VLLLLLLIGSDAVRLSSVLRPIGHHSRCRPEARRNFTFALASSRTIQLTGRCISRTPLC